MTIENLFRVVLSVVLGGVIGMEREFHEKPAGLRTNILICLGATILTILSLEIGERFGQDPARISAQIVSGVGFLGAGAILRDGVKVTGLTTAAGIWLIAAIGMAVGYGYYWLSIGSACLTLLVQIFLAKFEQLFSKYAKQETVHVNCKPTWDAVDMAYDRLVHSGVKVLSKKITKQAGAFHVDFLITGPRNAINEAISRLIDMPDISDVHV